MVENGKDIEKKQIKRFTLENVPQSNFLDTLVPIKEEKESQIQGDEKTREFCSIKTGFTTSDSLFTENKYKVI